MRKLFRTYLTFFLLGSLVVTATSCGDDDAPNPDVEQEEIASARFTLTPRDDSKGIERWIEYKESNQNPTMNSLLTNAVYNGALELFDGTGNPITIDGATHEVFYEVLDNINLTVAKTDTDSNNRPVGLATTVTAGAPSQGRLRVTLKHQPSKGASDPNQGETDLTMVINMSIK